MSSGKPEALIATCIDYRLQSFINSWISENLKSGTFDRVALGGGVKNLNVILEQVKIGHDLHQIQKVILANHEDCGAYGSEGTPEKHAADLKAAKEKINSLYPNLQVDLYYLHLDGEFEKITAI
jgi:carbonic anhydrase